jgi:hypothetical protein
LLPGRNSRHPAPQLYPEMIPWQYAVSNSSNYTATRRTQRPRPASAFVSLTWRQRQHRKSLSGIVSGDPKQANDLYRMSSRQVVLEVR